MGQATLPAFYSGPWTTLPAGWTKQGTGTYATDYDGLGEGSAKFDGSGDWIEIFFDGAPSTVSYWLKGSSLSGEYSYKVRESVDGSTWTDVASYGSANPINNSTPVQYTNNLLSSSRYAQFIYITKAVGNVGLDGVTIAGPGVPSVSFDPNGTTNAPVSNLFTMAVSITPMDAAMTGWSMEPECTGPVSLSDGGFSFTPDAVDLDQTFTVSVVATNSIGITTGTTSIVVTPFVPPMPVISLSPSEPYNIMATYTQNIAIGVSPAGSGISGWTLLPSNYAGTAILDQTDFTFTTAAPDGPATYTFTIWATNEYGTSTGTAHIVVGAYEPPPPEGSYICTFEDGSKTGYAPGDVTLSNKVWNLTGILIGSNAGDLKMGTKSARLMYDPTDGEETMTLQSAVMPDGISTISLWYGPYGTSGTNAPRLAIEISESLISGWSKVGEFNAGSVSNLTLYSTDVFVSTPVYVRIRSISGTVYRCANIDNITIAPFTAYAPPVPTVAFSPTGPISVMATYTQMVNILVAPTGGSGIKEWTFQPSDYAGVADISNRTFRFTPAHSDSNRTYTLTIVATNASGSDTGTVSIAVTPYYPTYPITITPSINGTLTTTPMSLAMENSTVVISATPTIGYMVESITVLDAELNPVAVTGNSFTMPSSAVSVSANFSYIPVTVVTNALRYQDFTAWSDPSFAIPGIHFLNAWSIQNASIAPTSGVFNTRAALLTPPNSAIVSPAFAEGVGQVTFWAKANKPTEPAYILLQTSIDAGSNWVNRASFTITTAATRYAWLYIANTAAMARLTFDSDQSSGDVLFDNIEIRVPAVYRNQNFDGWPARSAYTNDSYQGWFITNCSVGATYAYQGQSARLNTTISSYIQSPELPEGIGPISFWTRKYLASDPVFTLQIQVSSNGMNWTTLTNISATSTNYQQVAYYLNDPANRFVGLYHSAGASRVLIDDIRIAAPQPRPEIVITPGLDPPIPIADESMSLIADIEARFGASIISVTGVYRIAFGPIISTPMETTGHDIFKAIDDIPAQPVGTMVAYFVQVQYAGIGAAPNTVSYTTNLAISAVYTNHVGTQTFSTITVQGNFIGTNDPPPNMMRIADTPIWESDHHITNTAAVDLRFAANLDGFIWGVTNDATSFVLPASGTMIAGLTNYASVEGGDPGRYHITFNHLTGDFGFSRLYSDDSQGTGPNLFKNPGFELTTTPDGGDAVGWIAAQSWPKSCEDGYAPHSGNWCGAIHGRWFVEWTNSGSFAQEVPVGEGRTYRASAWFKATPDWTADSMRVKLEWLYADGAIAGRENLLNIAALSADWVKYSVEGVAPTNAARARVSFLCRGAGTTGSMHMDDAEMRSIGPTNYYASAFGLSGLNLRRMLQEIISVAKINGYDSLHSYYITSDARPDGRVWDMYSDNPNGIPPYIYPFDACEQAGTYRIEGDVYNREHSWPKSWFNDLAPMNTDIFHIYPTDGRVNGNRGSYPFGEITWPAIVSLNGSKTGPCSTPGYSGFVFEPVDEYKGDFARTYFYMSTRYYGQDQNWLANAAVTAAELNPWTLEMLLRWHEDDPVSLKELIRNEAACAVQGNRNPFIDYPEWAHDIWGYATNRDLSRITIGNPISLLSSVSPDPGVMSIQGQVSSQVAGELVWSNSTTRGAGSLLLTGTNFLLPDIPLAYGKNILHVVASNHVGQTAGRSLVVFRQTGARETFDNDFSWIGGLCEKNWDDEFTTLRYVPTNRMASNEEFMGTQVAIKKSMTMDAHGCSWGMNPYSSGAMVRFQTPLIATNFSVYLANYTTNVPTSFMVLISTNSGGSYEVLLATNNAWFGTAQQFKKYESPPLYAKPQPGMLTYIEIVKTSGEMLFLDDFNCVTSIDPNDLDMDNVPDLWELEYFADLTITDGTGDDDQDRLSDIDEFFFGTNPLLQDTDGDGQSDGAEFIAGTSGADSLDFFAIKEINEETEALDPLVFYWDTVTGRTYRVLIGGSMLGGWNNVLQVTGDGQRKNYTNESSDPVGFFRLTVEKP